MSDLFVRSGNRLFIRFLPLRRVFNYSGSAMAHICACMLLLPHVICPLILTNTSMVPFYWHVYSSRFMLIDTNMRSIRIYQIPFFVLLSHATRRAPAFTPANGTSGVVSYTYLSMLFHLLLVDFAHQWGVCDMRRVDSCLWWSTWWKICHNCSPNAMESASTTRMI
jgi:hypothetical protein